MLIHPNNYFVITAYLKKIIACSIPLIPLIYDCSGSAVPLYKGWIDFLKELNAQLPGIKYLEHRKRIKEQIVKIEKSIEQEEISNILEG
jgi:hypothetical protein